MKKIILFLIRIYQKTLSLDHGKMGELLPNIRFCKFNPSCSVYSYEAIEKYGVLKGGFMTVWRILRCNPFTKPGTYDPVP
ncbi:MAG: membrane protein insertion efficiency factor YidD [Candidatus Dojkabacteria bacterium]